ncbi:MAG: hypothetical protein LCI00_26565 [Chloroflexi bacterium]|nr:hypothetical protein [Chloroflexota bacterium]MCC6894413.1 hypothetical protein [Anaerolineae bacterium]
MKRLLLFCLTLLLAACGGNAAQNGGTPVPTVDAAGINAGSFKATVSGAVSGEFTGTGNYFRQEGGGFLISLVATDGPPGASVSIILPEGTLPGIYTPKSYAEAYDANSNKITGVGASFSVLADTTGVDSYAFVSEGTLTLQATDPMTGQITFKALMESGGEVEVTATFYQLSAI